MHHSPHWPKVQERVLGRLQDKEMPLRRAGSLPYTGSLVTKRPQGHSVGGERSLTAFGTTEPETAKATLLCTGSGGAFMDLCHCSSHACAA